MKKNIGNITFFIICGILFFVIFSQLGILPFRFMFLRSGSMEPTYQPGDMTVIYMNQDLAVQSGDVVLFTAAIGPTIHRVVAVENGMITTQGDANNAPDSSKIKKVDGKVLFAIPKVGYAVDFIQTIFRSIAQIFAKSYS